MPKRKPLRTLNPVKKSKCSVPVNASEPSNSVNATNDDDKKLDEEDDDDNDDDEDDENENDEICMEGMIEDEPIPITFEFKDMRENCTSGLSNLLSKFIYQKDLYEIACIISQQIAVGTTISCEDGEDIFAYSTLLPLSYVQTCSRFRNILQECLKVIQESKSISVEIKALYTQYLSIPTNLTSASSSVTNVNHQPISQCGILLHNRFANLPLPLIGALHKNLKTDLDWAKRQEEEEAVDSSLRTTDRTFSSVDMMCLISKSTLSSDGDGGNSTKALRGIKVSADKSVAFDVTGSSSLLFDLFEDEVYVQHARSVVYIRQVSSLQGSFAIALVPVASYPAVITSIVEMLPTT